MLREAEIKGEIKQLWKEHFKLAEEANGCFDSPPKKRAITLMRKLLKEGEDKRWVREMEAIIRLQAARIYQAAGKLSEAEELLKKAQRLLDRYPECQIELDLEKGRSDD